MAKPELNDILLIFAKHVNWHDEGDRRLVADYLDRDADEPDTFGPREHDETNEKEPDETGAVKASPANVAKSQPTRNPTNVPKRSN